MNTSKPSEETPVNKGLVDYQPRLFAVIRVMVGRKQDVMDILQETNLAIVRHAEEYDPSRPIWPWLKEFALRQVLKYYRNQHDNRVVFDSGIVNQMAEMLEDERFIDKELIPAEDVGALQACLDKLPPMKRELLRERYEGHQQLQDVAAKHSLTPSSLALLMFRIRRALQECIDRIRHGRESGKADDVMDDFGRSLDLFLDDALPDKDRAAFTASLRSFPGLLREYMRQTYLHSLLLCERGALFKSGIPLPVKPTFRVAARWGAVAACLALFLGGGICVRSFLSCPPAATSAAGVPYAVAQEGKTKSSDWTQVSNVVAKQIKGDSHSREPSMRDTAVSAVERPVLPVTKTEAQKSAVPKQEEEKMNASALTRVAAVAAAVAVIPKLAVSETQEDGSCTSVAVPVIADAAASVYWHTLPSGNPVFRWEWPSGSKKVTITAYGYTESLSGTFTNPVDAAEFRFKDPVLSDMSGDVYTVVFVFDNGVTVSNRLGRVGGVNGAKMRCVKTSNKADRPWNRLGDNAVLPVEKGDTALTFDNVNTVTLDGQAGWYGWKVKGTGSHSITRDDVKYDMAKMMHGTLIMLF